jgi:hypothetical protein
MSTYYVSNENGDWWTIETESTKGQRLFIMKEEDLAKVTDIRDFDGLDRIIREHGTIQNVEVA